MTLTIPSFTFVHITVMMLGWIAFIVIFATRPRPPRTTERTRDRASIAGIIVQMIAYASVWTLRRGFDAPFTGSGEIAQSLVTLVEVALVIGSLWLVRGAVQVLGKQWSFAARVVEEHELVTSGPYAIVRHPIYTGMLGMLVATGIALSAWWVVLAATAVFLAGTLVRTRAEERLLRATFGEKFDRYAAAVPALIPRLPPGRTAF